MIRALLVIAAILSAVLGAVLDIGLLYIAAAGLIATAGVLWLLRIKGKFEFGKPDSTGFSPVEEDLSALGIIEIRPRATGDSQAPVEDSASKGGEPSQVDMFGSGTSPMELDGGEVEVSAVPIEEAVSEGFVRETRPVEVTAESRQRGSPYVVTSVLDESEPLVLAPILQSLCAALSANTVCIVGSSTDARVHRIHAIVSQNAYARSAGELTVKKVLPLRPPTRGVTVERAMDSAWSPQELTYYRDEIAVKELALTRVPFIASSEKLFLVADSMKEGVLDSAAAKAMLEQFARTIGAVLTQPGIVPASANRIDVRSRRDIIAEEIERAREDAASMALALVMLNEAEALSVDPKSADRAEAELRKRLKEAAPGHRIEKFGDQMMGVFYRGGVNEVEAWAVDVYGALADDSGLLAGGVSVGVAMLMDHHTEPETLRADAAAALQEAFESGTCTILE